jgi:glycosyltransferase involved in cell wall biosynthesis
MKIGMVLDHPFPADERVEKEALSLIESGHEVYLLCLGDKGATTEKYKQIILEKVSAPNLVVHKLRGLVNTILNIYSYLWAYWIVKYVNKHKIEILHIHDLYMFGSALLARRILRKNIPLVGDLHENYADALKYYRFSSTFPGNLLISIKKWKRTEKKWIGMFDHIIAVAPEMLNRIKPYLRDGQEAVVIHNYADNVEFLDYIPDKSIMQKYANDFIISYIGRIDYHRGIDTVLKALHILSDLPDLKFLLVGPRKNDTHINTLIKKYDLESRIILEDFKPFGLLQNYYQVSDIGLIPHLKSVQTDNTSPNKLYHYMLMAKPVVVSNCTYLENVVGKSNAGLVFESGNPDDLARQLKTLYLDKTLRAQLGTNGKKAVLANLNWSTNTKILKSLYDKLEKMYT